MSVVNRAHGLARPFAVSAIGALVVFVMNSAQQAGYIPPNPQILPVAILALFALVLYIVVTNDSVLTFIGRVYDKYHLERTRRRAMTYVALAIIGAAIGAIILPTAWRLYERHRQHLLVLAYASMQADADAEPPESYRNAVRIISVITKTDDTHPPGTMIAGVPWHDGFIITTIALRNTAPVRVTNVEMTLRLDVPAFRVEQITNVPNIYIAPISAFSGIGAWEGESLDKDGKPEKRVVATPEQLRIIKEYSPTRRFSIKAATLFNDVPLELVLLSASGKSYTIGIWTFLGNGVAKPLESVQFTGSYEVQHKGQTVTMPITISYGRKVPTL